MSEITNNPSVPTQVVADVHFPKFMTTLGIIPTSYKDSMSYYECLAWLCKYLEETVIPTVNQNGLAVEELQSLYVQLNEYVTHYFDNLDVQEEINNKLDEMVEDGTLSSLIAEYFSSYITPEMFGAVGDGSTDDTAAFIAAIESISTGGILMLRPNKNYLISDSIEVPLNVSIQGMQTFNDISSKVTGFSDTDLTKGMSTISMVDNARFLLDGNNDIEKIVIAYPEQNYDIKNVSKSASNPDGLTNFIEYYPTFTMNGGNIGVVLKDIIYLGGYQIFYSDKNMNPEKLFVDRIVGMCVGTGFKITNCRDTMSFNNIVMNANSLKPFINKVDGSDINFYTKCAKNTVLFSFGDTINDVNYGCDGSYFNNCFAYGIKRFMELYGDGNSPQINQCGCDVCHEFLYIDSHVKPFGTYLNNITVTPLVYKPIIDNSESNNSPCVVRINSSDHKINITNLTVFGNTISYITDSNKCNYAFSINSSSQNSRLDIVNAKITANYLQEGFNVIGKNNISQASPNSYRILTLTNVALNGNSVDSNINQSRTIYEVRTAGTGTQTISGIGFRPSNIMIRSTQNGSHMYSIGTSDGVISKSISQTESGVQLASGGNGVIQEWATNISNRYYAELQSINDDGFVLNWSSAGNTLPEGNFGMIITCTR